MKVLLLTRDLMTQSRVEAAAQRRGVLLSSLPDATSLLAKCAESTAALVIVDLTSSVNVATLVAQLKTTPGAPPTIIAFGPHVHEALLDAATQAGCDEVFSRGQFFAQLDEVISRNLGDPS